MNDIFDRLVNYFTKDDSLKNSINSFHFLELSNDVSYPAILIKNKSQNYNLQIYEKLSNIEIKIDLVLLDDSHDEIQFLNLYDKIINLIMSFVLIDEKIQIIGNCTPTSQIKKNDIFQGNFEIDIRVFFL